MNHIIEIYTDGSSLGNPGPGGWGIVITADGQIIHEQGGWEDTTTNNRMELVGAISALEYVLHKHKGDTVIIHTDSAYVLGGITLWVHSWEKNGWKTSKKEQVLNQDLWEKLVSLTRLFGETLSWQKVKGHAGIEFNERADQIATGYAALKDKFIF